MSLSGHKTVSNTQCYVYDPTSHEECDVDDSSWIDKMQASKSESGRQPSSQSAMSNKAGSFSSGGTRASGRIDNKNSSSRNDGSTHSRDMSSGRGVHASSHERGSSRLQASADLGSKKDNAIVLSDDESKSTKRRHSRDKERRRSGGRSRTPRKRSRSRSRSRSDKIRVMDFRQMLPAQPSVLPSHSRDRRSKSRERHRSRSRSSDRSKRWRSDRRHDKEKSLSEMEQLKERIEKLKAEIKQTREEKDSYLQHNRSHDDDFPMSADYDERPLPGAFGDRFPSLGQTDSLPWHSSNDVPPPQLQSATAEVPRDNNRNAEKSRGEVSEPAATRPARR